MDAVEQAKSGHPGMPMGMADVATVLFTRFLKFDAADPDWPDRDRFVLSAGHGSMLLYALLHLTGYPDVTIEELKRFRQLGSTTPGHPEYGHTPGVETTTGPLGQGLATAVGMALAERLLRARFGADLVDHHTYVIAGDGCLMEGISHEAISLAGHLGLGRLIVLFDDNAISIDGPTILSYLGRPARALRGLGWPVRARRRPRSRGGRRRHRARARRATGRRSSPAAPSSAAARRTGRARRGRTARRSGRRDRGRARARRWAGRTRPSSSPSDVLAAWRAVGDARPGRARRLARARRGALPQRIGPSSSAGWPAAAGRACATRPRRTARQFARDAAEPWRRGKASQRGALDGC